MGKRTKFQVDSKPQLRVAEATSSEGTATKVAVPESSELNEDSVLLEDVAFDDQKRRANVQDPRRAALTSCVALALCLDVKNTNPYAPASASIQLAATPSRTRATPHAAAAPSSLRLRNAVDAVAMLFDRNSRNADAGTTASRTTRCALMLRSLSQVRWIGWCTRQHYSSGVGSRPTASTRRIGPRCNLRYWQISTSPRSRATRLPRIGSPSLLVWITRRGGSWMEK